VVEPLHVAIHQSDNLPEALTSFLRRHEAGGQRLPEFAERRASRVADACGATRVGLARRHHLKANAQNVIKI